MANNAFEFYISGNKIPEPSNWQDLSIEVSFQNSNPSAVMNSTKLTWMSSNAAIVYNWLKGGLDGTTPGVFEGLPITIKACNSGIIVMDGYIDLTDPEALFSCDEVTLSIKDKIESSLSLLDAISFAHLAAPVSNGGSGTINPLPVSQGGDYIPVPYNLNFIPDGFQVLMTVFAIYEVTVKAVESVSNIVGDLTGTGTVASTLLWAPAGIISVTYLVFHIIEFLVMIACLVVLLIQLSYELLGPIIPYNKLGMNCETLFERICQYFGWGFSSSIMSNPIYTNLLWLPRKGAWANNKKYGIISEIVLNLIHFNMGQRMMYDDLTNLTSGGFAYGYPDGSCGDWVREMEKVFCAKARIILDSSGNPVLHFERWDFFYDHSGFKIPNISDVAPFPQPFGINASELASNYEVIYSTDSVDLNTLNTYEGVSCYAQSDITNPQNRKYRTLLGLTEVNLSCAQGTIKRELNATEKVFDAMWDVVIAPFVVIATAIHKFTDAVNVILKLAGLDPIPLLPVPPLNPLAGRLQNLLLSNNITSVPKLLLMADKTSGKLADTSQVPGDIGSGGDPISARNLMKYFHFSKLPFTSQPGGVFSDPPNAVGEYTNQYNVFRSQRMQMCCSDFASVKNKNYVSTYDGQLALVDSLKWNAFTGTCTMDYRVRKKYATNMTVGYVIDGATSTKTL